MGVSARLRDLAKTPTQHEADELHRVIHGRLPVASAPLRDREIAEVRGVVRSVTIPPRRSVPVLVAELYDGRTSVNLIWVGRRRIGGIEPGAFLRARGRVAMKSGVPTIFNPPYELVRRR